nr:MAG TPA: hypothetical protein [Caudoviricetes sp.]
MKRHIICYLTASMSPLAVFYVLLTRQLMNDLL